VHNEGEFDVKKYVIFVVQVFENVHLEMEAGERIAL
jgi:hypothetical protein